MKPPTQAELNEAMRQLQSRQHNSQLASAPSNKIRQVRAHIPFSQEVVKHALQHEARERYRQAKGIETSRSLVVSKTGRERARKQQSKMSPNGLSTLEKAMMWR